MIDGLFFKVLQRGQWCYEEGMGEQEEQVVKGSMGTGEGVELEELLKS